MRGTSPRLVEVVRGTPRIGGNRAGHHVADGGDGRLGLRSGARGAVPTEDEAMAGQRGASVLPPLALVLLCFCGSSGGVLFLSFLSSQTYPSHKQRTTWRQRPSSKSASRTRGQSVPGALALPFLTSDLRRTRERRRLQAVEK